MEKIQFSKKLFKDQLYDINQIIKAMYKSFNCHEQIILPTTDEDIKLSIFKRSAIVLDDQIEYSFFNTTKVDPIALTDAFKLKGKNLECLKDNDIYYIQEENNPDMKVIIAEDIICIDNNDFVDINEIIEDPNTYTNSYILSQEDIESLLDYNAKELCIGYDENNYPIKFISTLKVFPAIKKADRIVIYSRKCEISNVYKLMIVSEIVDKMRLYTVHYIINF